MTLMLCGHGRLGAHSPITALPGGTSSHAFLVEEFRRLERPASGEPPVPRLSKGAEGRPLDLW